jgi:hypothetical protein
MMFDLTEDMNVDEHESDGLTKRTLASRSNLSLLYEPLPADLPTVQKDVLIQMAAYFGNVDRYVRLRRLKGVYVEMLCCVRGIYHSTFFAVWWSNQPGPKGPNIEKAINARFIMNNVLSRAPFRAGCVPYLIWWPKVAQESTYRHLAKLQPEMIPQIVRACIYAGYQTLFDELLSKVTIDTILTRDAESQGFLYFRQALKERAKALGIVPQDPPTGQDWRFWISSGFAEDTELVPKFVDDESVVIGFEAPYDGIQCDASVFELIACLPEKWMLSASDEKGSRYLDYDEWPPADESGNGV